MKRATTAAPRKIVAAPKTDPARSARDAGLHYVSDDRPGIRRLRRGKGFEFVAPNGRRIAGTKLDRIRALAVPPAYTKVWISPDPLGHLQATGYDARGRKQYRYHALFRSTRDDVKFERLVSFARALPRIRARVHVDLGREGLPREKVLATVVRLLETTAIRVGNDEYARDNGHYGLSTLRNRHVDVRGSDVRFKFAGKSGKTFECSITDPRLALVVRRCQNLPGQELFQYVDDEGKVRDVGSSDVNAYLREIADEDYTAKDFRTWKGTLLAVDLLRAAKKPDGEVATRQAIVAAIDGVAEQLNNTRAVCRKYYVHPAVLDAYAEGFLRRVVKSPHVAKSRARGLHRFEREVSSLLRRRARPGGGRTGAPRARSTARKSRAVRDLARSRSQSRKSRQ